MALFGIQMVVTMVMASVIQKLSLHYSLAKWILCTRLVRYLHPTDHELRTVAGVPPKQNKNKGRKGRGRDRHKNGMVEEEEDEIDEFLVPKNIQIELDAAKIQQEEILQLRFYMEYQWLIDFAVYAVIVYSLTELYFFFLPNQNEINLSLIWCLLVIGFALKVLFSLTALYFKGEEPIGERSMCLMSGFFFFFIAMVVLIIDEGYLEVGLKDAYTSFNESSYAFLERQGLDSSGPASQLMFKFFLALWCGFMGAFFTFPGMRFAKMHKDTFKYCEGRPFIKLLLHISFIAPFIISLLWVKPIARDYFTNRTWPGIKGHLMHTDVFDTSRLVAIILLVLLRLFLMPFYLQSYLNMAPDKLLELRKEAGRISNIELQKMIARIYYYLCVVALQYVAPLLLCIFTTLLLKTLGEYRWSSYIWPVVEGTCSTEPIKPVVDPNLDPDSILAATQKFSLTLAGLRTVFSPVMFRGILSFMTWWLCALSFCTSGIGLIYHSYNI